MKRLRDRWLFFSYRDRAIFLYGFEHRFYSVYIFNTEKKNMYREGNQKFHIVKLTEPFFFSFIIGNLFDVEKE